MIESNNLLGNTITRHALSEIEMKRLNAIRGAS